MAALNGTVGAFYTSKIKALELDISDDYVTVTDPSSGVLDMGNNPNMSFEIWANISDGSNGVVLSKGGVASAGYRAEISDSVFSFGVIDDTSTFARARSTSDVANDRWMHLTAVVSDHAGNQISIRNYVNGIADGSNLFASGSTFNFANASDLIIGDKGAVSPTRRIGMVRMWNKALSATQISDLHDGGFPVNSKNNVIGEWWFHEGRGTTVIDSSGQGNDGTISGSTWVTTTYDTVTAETLGTANGSLTEFSTDFPNVDNDNLTVTVDGTAQVLGDDFKMTPKGTITFHTAPASGSVVATYRHYPMTLEAGGVTGWSLDWTAEALDTTDFLSSGAREFISGLRTWTATAERHWVNKMAVPMVTEKVILKLFHDEPNDAYYNGWAIVTGLHPSVAVEGLVDETLDFQGTSFLGVETTR